MSKMEEGINSYLAGDVNSAIKFLTEYLKDGRPFGQVYFYLGLAHNDIGKNNEAGVYFQKALELEPNKGIYNYHLGLVYSQLMLFQPAIEHLKKTVTQNPEHVRAYFILGNMYFKCGDLANAIEMYEKVIKLSPHFAPAYYEMGNCNFYKGNLDGAEKMYLKCLEISDNADTYHKLSLIYIEKKDITKSFEYLKKAIENGFCSEQVISSYQMLLEKNGLQAHIIELKKITGCNEK